MSQMKGNKRYDRGECVFLFLFVFVFVFVVSSADEWVHSGDVLLLFLYAFPFLFFARRLVSCLLETS